MFVTEEDYKVVIGDSALKVISQVSTENRNNAEMEAQEEISGYLRPKYNCTKVFTAEGDDRNRLIVMYTCDIALYHMSAAMPQKMGTEIREERYKRAIEWLEGVQAGKILPQLPEQGDEEDEDGSGEDAAYSFRYSSQPKLRNNW